MEHFSRPRSQRDEDIRRGGSLGWMPPEYRWPPGWFVACLVVQRSYPRPTPTSGCLPPQLPDDEYFSETLSQCVIDIDTKAADGIRGKC